MTTSFATSSDGTDIAFVTEGDPAAPSILLIHGWAQQFTCWTPILRRLSGRFHLVAMDLRGHGASAKPEVSAAYTDTRLWADDVRAVMTAARLDRPLLVGWSYGSRVVAAYLATHGEGDISGVALAGGILAIGSAREDWMVGPASPGLDRDLYTDDVPRRLEATARFVEACTTEPLDRSTYARMVGTNMLCPAHVRRALFEASVDFRPVYAALSRPALIVHGAEDRVVSPATGEAAARIAPIARHLPYEGVGHMPFLEAPERFAADLADFAIACRD
jgi:non-heme chloroperoxidase